MALVALNLTLVELKLCNQVHLLFLFFSLNLTLVELKPTLVATMLAHVATLNLTLVELKQRERLITFAPM